MGMIITPKFEDEEETMVSTTKTVSTQTPSLLSKPPQGKPMASTAPASNRVVTGVVRGSYLKVFKAELPKNSKPGDIPKFGMTVLIPKSDTATLARIAAAQETAINIKWPSKRPAKIDTTLHDGDLPRPSTGEPFGDECAGHMVMALNTKNKPKIGDRDGNEIIDAGAINSGDYFKVSMGFFAYDASGKRGVSAGLNSLLFWEKGTSLGGGGSFESDFADDLPKA
jgi:hypothetical protein